MRVGKIFLIQNELFHELPVLNFIIHIFTPYVSHHQEVLQETLFVVRDPLCKGWRYCIRCHLHSAAVIHFKPVVKPETRDFSLSSLLEFTFCTSLWLDFTCATAWLYRRNSLSSDFLHAAKTLSWVSTHRVAAALVTPPHSFNSCLSFFPFSFFHLSLLLVLDEKLETAHINSTKQTQSWLKQKRWSQSSAHRTGTPR